MISNRFTTTRRRGAVPTIATLALALAAVLAAAPGPVAAHDPDPVLSGGLFAQNADLRFRWATGGTPPAAVRTAVQDAAGDSNASRRSKAATFTYDTAGSNAVYYGTEVPCGLNGLACFRRDAPTWFGIWLRENGHRYDWGTLRWCEMNGDPDGCFDAENVVLDELGHVLGLDHHVNYPDDSDYTDAVVQTYTHAKPRVGWNAHVFGRCDVATLQQQYDVASWSTLYSTCLSIDTAITLSASATTVAAGSPVTFTAKLTSDGDGRLAGNPMSGRIVVLQQRTATGWADRVTMSPGSSSGTYVESVAVSASGDYRALYRRTATEGTRGSGSTAISISAFFYCMQWVCPLSGGGGNL